MSTDRTVAYFSMEIALEPGIPTYSGGLGVLAGDTIRSAADLQVPMVAVTLVHRKGYFYQRLDASGQQSEQPVAWSLDDFLSDVGGSAALTIEGRELKLRAWKYEVKGSGGFIVPVYLIDADLPENSDWDRSLTDFLYGGDARYRLCQEVILGIGGVRMLQSLGYNAIQRFHMNEGHASLLALELLEQHAQQLGRKPTLEDVEAVRRKCVFTTHTPVPAGHDQFPLDLVQRVLGANYAHQMKEVFCCDDTLNMTFLALNLSHYVNGVAKKHREVTRHMFASYTIDSITNGVHAASWTAPAFRQLFDKHIPGWREDNFSMRYALSISPDEIWQAHEKAKHELIHYVNRVTNAGMDVDVLTLGFARRAATYKRPDLLFRDADRLKRIAHEAGRFQVVYAGKAHPRDQAGKDLIKRIFQARENLKGHVKIAYLENYDLELGALITAGVDVWLNTPQPPMEASGTSGMKAALNGVPSLSVLDGWWIEGCIEGITGWSIGDGDASGGDDGNRDAESLCDKLETSIIPMYYKDRERFIDVMRHAIALNGSFFNTQRMIQQYVLKAYYQ